MVTQLEKTPLDKEIILRATEEAIRRFGPDKANITDVAKSLHVSHAAIYRYFNGKSALWDAVTERWLAHMNANLEKIMHEEVPADAKLYRLLVDFAEAKRRSAIHDPEMFANYLKLAHGSTEVIKRSIEEGIRRIEGIIVQGISEGIFFADSPHQAARAVYIATGAFINPNSFEDPNRRQDIESVIHLLISGLKNPTP